MTVTETPTHPPADTSADTSAGAPGSDDRTRRAWIVVGSIVAVAFLGWSVFEAVGLVSREQRTIRRTYDVAGLDAVHVTTDTGDITVIADSEERIRVEIRVVESFAGVDVEQRRVDGELQLSGRCPAVGSFCSADYVVHLPQRLAVEATADDGDVVIRGAGGVVRASSDNGDVTATGLRGGSAFLTSRNGDVRGDGLRSGRVRATSENGDVRLGFAVAPRSVEARSDNGDVRVELPTGSELYAAEARSDNGEATTRVRTDPSSDRPVTAVSDNGDVVIAYG